MSKSPPGSTFGLVFLWTWIYLWTCLSLRLVFLWTCLSLDLSFFGLGSTFGLVPYVDLPLDLSFFGIPWDLGHGDTLRSWYLEVLRPWDLIPWDLETPVSWYLEIWYPCISIPWDLETPISWYPETLIPWDLLPWDLDTLRSCSLGLLFFEIPL